MTDEMYEACICMINALSQLGKEQRNVGSAMLDMLCDFDEWRWIARTQKENEDWIQEYIEDLRGEQRDYRK